MNNYWAAAHGFMCEGWVGRGREHDPVWTSAGEEQHLDAASVAEMSPGLNQLISQISCPCS